jgi:Domain of unknown function (DU1801)
LKPKCECVAVSEKFASYPPNIRTKLLQIRKLIFDTAASTDGVGELTEALKWGEPAYLTNQTKSGSTIRIDWKPAKPTQYAVYFHCQTDLIEKFRTLFPADFRFEGNRALLFDEDQEILEDSLGYCIAAALSYHRRKKPDAP